MSDYFPHEIIIQILHKLPIKSLVRCTCICKSWHSLVRNTSFISNHLTLNTNNNHHLLLFRLYSENSEHYSLHVDNQELALAPYMLLDFPFTSFGPYFRVIGTFNGIICLVDDVLSRTKNTYTYTIILWNPLIKKANVTFSTPANYQSFIGFGFDSITNDYKVLRITNLISYGEEATIEVDLYSLNTNSWKTMTCVAPNYEFNAVYMQAFVNGVLHWVAYKRMRNNNYRNVVLGFDMGDEAFREIKLPNSLAGAKQGNIYVRKYGDSSIAVIKHDYRNDFQCHIWVMKEYGVVGSWTQLVSLGEARGGMSTVLGFRKSGEGLLEMSDGRIVTCDPQSKILKHLGVGGQARCCFVDGYVESLVLLDNSNAVSDANAAIVARQGLDIVDDSSDARNDTSDDEMEDGEDAVDASDAFS